MPLAQIGDPDAKQGIGGPTLPGRHAGVTLGRIERPVLTLAGDPCLGRRAVRGLVRDSTARIGRLTLRRVTGATNRTLAYVGLGALAVMIAIQAVIFGVWGNDGDPPDAVVAIAFVVFWCSVLVLLTVIVLAVRRRLALRHG